MGPPPVGPGSGQPGWGAHPAMEFRPGIVPLRPLNLGDIYGAVIKAIRGNVAATMGLAFITTLIFLVPTTALGVWVAAQQDVLDVGTTDDIFPVAGTIGSLVPSLGTMGSTILLTGFVAFVISQAVMGRKVSASQTWEGTRGRILPLVGATIVTGLAILLAVAAIVVLPVLAIIAAVQTQSVAPDDSGWCWPSCSPSARASWPSCSPCGCPPGWPSSGSPWCWRGPASAAASRDRGR